MIEPKPITDLSQIQIAWAVITLLIILLGFFIKSWFNGINKSFDNLVKKLDCKQDKSMCADRYPRLQGNINELFRHKHPIKERSDETGGLFIP